jgi:hypothetical protein
MTTQSQDTVEFQISFMGGQFPNDTNAAQNSEVDSRKPNDEILKGEPAESDIKTVLLINILSEQIDNVPLILVIIVSPHVILLDNALKGGRLNHNNSTIHLQDGFWKTAKSSTGMPPARIIPFTVLLMPSSQVAVKILGVAAQVRGQLLLSGKDET